MTDRVIFRAAAYVALATALGVGAVHALAVAGRAAASVTQLLAVAFPVLGVSALAYIVARHRVHTPPRPPLWMYLAWTAAFAYMAVNARLAARAAAAPGAPGGDVLLVRELSGHLLAFLVVVALGLLSLARQGMPEESGERAA